MSKKLIAGAGVGASCASALAPLATFATGTTNPRGITDTLNVTIEKVCSFGYKQGATQVVSLGSHTDGSELSTDNISGTQADTPSNGKTAGMGYGKWDSTTLTAYDIPAGGEPTKSGETAYAVMETGTNNPNFAKTTMNIVCNNKDGYTLTATPSALTGETNGETIVAAGYGDSVTTSTWGYKFAAATGSDNTNTLTNAAQTWNANASAAQVITLTSGAGVATKATGDSFTITYGVSVATNLSADTYEGSIDYLLAEI